VWACCSNKCGAAAGQAHYWATHQRQRQRADRGDVELGKVEELARKELQSQRAQEADAAGG
jgi:hypothetical protein